MLILRYKILLVLTIYCLVNINNCIEPKYYFTLYTQITMFNLFGFVYSYSLPEFIRNFGSTVRYKKLMFRNQ